MTGAEEINELVRRGREYKKQAAVEESGGGTAFDTHQLAASVFAEATTLAEALVGPYDASTLNYRDLWAVSLRQAGNIKSAIDCDRENIARHTKAHGEWHTCTLEATRRLAGNLLTTEQFEESIVLYKKVVDAATSEGVDIHTICQDRADWAEALLESGTDCNVHQAVNESIKSVGMTEKDLGVDHIETLRNRYKLGLALATRPLKKYQDASDQFQKIVDILQTDPCQAKSDPEHTGLLEDSRDSLERLKRRIHRRTPSEHDKTKNAEPIKIAEAKTSLGEDGEISSQLHNGGSGRQYFHTDEHFKAREGHEETLDEVTDEVTLAKVKTGKETQEESADKERAEGERLEWNNRQILKEIAGNSSKPTEKPDGNTREKKIHVEGSEKRKTLELQEQESANPVRRKPQLEIAGIEGTDQGELAHKKLVQKLQEGEETQAKPIQEELDPQDPDHQTVHLRDGSLQLKDSGCKRLEATNEDQDKRDGETLTERALEGNEPETERQQILQPKEEQGSNRENEEENSSQKMLTHEGYKQCEQQNSEIQDLEDQKQTREPEGEQLENTEANNHIVEAARLYSLDERHESLEHPQCVETKLRPTDHDVIQDRKEEERQEHLETVSNRDEKQFSIDKKPDNAVIGAQTEETGPEVQGTVKDDSQEMPREEQQVTTQDEAHEIREETQPTTPDGAAEPAREGEQGVMVKNAQSRIQEQERAITPQEEQRSAETDRQTAVIPEGQEMTENEGHRSIVHDREEQNDSPVVHQPVIAIEKQAHQQGPLEIEPPEDTPHLHNRTSRSTSNSPNFQGRLFSRFRSFSDYTSRAATVVSIRNSLFGSPYQFPDAIEKEIQQLPNEQAHPTILDEITDLEPALGEANIAEDIDTQPSIISRAETIPDNEAGGDILGDEQSPFEGIGIDSDSRRTRSDKDLLHSPTEDGKARSSSRRPPRSSISTVFTHEAKTKADEWFSDLAYDAHTFLDKYRDDNFSGSKKSRKVKIAVLDTGISWKGATPLVPDLISKGGSRIKLGKKLHESLPPYEDVNGHGTHAAGLILQVCPYADVYVYRVSLDGDTISQQYVTEALTDAMDKNKVDIVSMSLGWNEDSDERLRAAIDRAKTNSVLLFAASSNDGIRGRKRMAYPARADEVIAIDAADGFGLPSKINTPGGEKSPRFTALGEAVNSAYPTHPEDRCEKPGWRRMSGTSCATPIAAAIAGLILEFSRQRPLCFDKSVEDHLKSVAGMREVLKKLFALKATESSHFNHLDPNRRFYCTENYVEGGEWCENSSPRLNAANAIVECLGDRFAPTIGSQMNKKIEDEWSRRSQTRVMKN